MDVHDPLRRLVRAAQSSREDLRLDTKEVRSPKRIKNATKRAKSAMASERAKPKMAYPKSCFESDGLRDTE